MYLVARKLERKSATPKRYPLILKIPRVWIDWGEWVSQKRIKIKKTPPPCREERYFCQKERELTVIVSF